MKINLALNPGEDRVLRTTFVCPWESCSRNTQSCYLSHLLSDAHFDMLKGFDNVFFPKILLPKIETPQISIFHYVFSTLKFPHIQKRVPQKFGNHQRGKKMIISAQVEGGYGTN